MNKKVYDCIFVESRSIEENKMDSKIPFFASKIVRNRLNSDASQEFFLPEFLDFCCSTFKKI